MIAQCHLIDCELERFRKDLGLPPFPVPQQVARVLQYVHEHLFEPELNVKVAKAQCHLRDNNITLHFRRAMGTGLREYIEQLRLEAADRVLGSHELPVYRVAMAVGYTYPETFCRAFQRRFGRQPSWHQGLGGGREIIKRNHQEESS
jgi:AraC-like DNA-binding protein